MIRYSYCKSGAVFAGGLIFIKWTKAIIWIETKTHNGTHAITHTHIDIYEWSNWWNHFHFPMWIKQFEQEKSSHSLSILRFISKILSVLVRWYYKSLANHFHSNGNPFCLKVSIYGILIKMHVQITNTITITLPLYYFYFDDVILKIFRILNESVNEIRWIENQRLTFGKF